MEETQILEEFISIHSLRMEGDRLQCRNADRYYISIHSLRMEGDCFSTSIPPHSCTFQSTPSVWRETICGKVCSLFHPISIHSLRMEGDVCPHVFLLSDMKFQSTPSVWRETCRHRSLHGNQFHFNPLPPYGGRLPPCKSFRTEEGFQSTPSVWRETGHNSCWRSGRCDFNPLPPYGGRQALCCSGLPFCGISIHSLRMEGDAAPGAVRSSPEHFNPLPPYGGRRQRQLISSEGIPFQSTPSVWRETLLSTTIFPHNLFQSTPSVWRETQDCCHQMWHKAFQSTPSVWRETQRRVCEEFAAGISIHSLRMEGDQSMFQIFFFVQISIHSLRMEGDFSRNSILSIRGNFNPLPPYGGRPVDVKQLTVHDAFQSTPSVWRETLAILPVSYFTKTFQSTPSVWRETLFLDVIIDREFISIHSLRMEGD